jgi:hypothetical protein
MKENNAATLAQYINRIGLPLIAKQDELFDLEVRPMIDAATTIRDRFELADGWRRVSTSTGIQRSFAKGKITLAKERILQSLLRKLRSAEAVAVGWRDVEGRLGPLEIIDPIQWSKLTMSWSENTVACDDVAFREVHVAMTDRMGQGPREQLLKLLLGGNATELEPRVGEGGIGATPGNPLYVSLAGAAERLVLKMETLRRNTRHGKVAAPKPEAAEPPKTEAEGPAQAVDPVEPTKPKKDPGPRTLNPEIKAHLQERSTKKICKPTWMEESLHLHSWAKSEFAKEIRSKSRVLAKLKRLREVHAAVYYRLNPEFDRRQRFQQESD